MKKSVYEIITEKFVEAIEAGRNPFWIKSWGSGGVCRNFVSGRAYRGVNPFILSTYNPGVPQLYCTWKQAQKKGWRVKNPKDYSLVTYWMFLYLIDGEKVTEEQYRVLKDDAEKAQKKAYPLYYKVFNITNIEGVNIEDYVTVNENDPIEDAEQLMIETGADINIQFSDRAYYSPARDSITLPELNQFKNPESFYSTAFHELGHWTGHSSRLDRDIINFHGTEKYAKEELVAEMCAAFICAELGIESEGTFNNSAAYLKGWLEPLKKDARFIFSVATEAQKASEFIMQLQAVEA